MHARVLAREKVSARQCKFSFPARQGVLISSSDTCGTGVRVAGRLYALRALACGSFRVRTQTLFDFVLKTLCAPLRRGSAGWAGGAKGACGGQARCDRDLHANADCLWFMRLASCFVFLYKGNRRLQRAQCKDTEDARARSDERKLFFASFWPFLEFINVFQEKRKS